MDVENDMWITALLYTRARAGKSSVNKEGIRYWKYNKNNENYRYFYNPLCLFIICYSNI